LSLPGRQQHFCPFGREEKEQVGGDSVVEVDALNTDGFGGAHGQFIALKVPALPSGTKSHNHIWSMKQVESRPAFLSSAFRYSKKHSFFFSFLLFIFFLN